LLVVLVSVLALPMRVTIGAERRARPLLPANVSPPVQDAPTPEVPSLRFDRLSTAEGLSYHTVTSILQDQRGFMWFGTEGGLNKYDGYEVTVHLHDADDLLSRVWDNLQAIVEDQRGNLWLAALLGLERWDPVTGTRVQFVHDPDDPASLSAGQVRTVCQDRAGTLWVGANGLNRYEPADGAFTRFLEDVAVFAIHEDREGNLWVGTSDGLKRFDRETETVYEYGPSGQGQRSFQNYEVVAIADDRQGNLWLGTYGGGLIWVASTDMRAAQGTEGEEASTLAFTQFQHDPDDALSLSDDRVTFVREDTAGRLWVGTWGGLDLFMPGDGAGSDREGGRFYHYRNDPYDPQSLSHNLVLTMFEDRAGVLWLGTADGVSKANGRADRFTLYRQRPEASTDSEQSPDAQSASGGVRLVDLSASIITAMYAYDADALWVGTFDGGLNKMQRASGAVTVYLNDPRDTNSLASNNVRSLYQDRTGSLWVGTDVGLEQYVAEVDAFWSPVELRGRQIRAILEDRSGTLWIAAAGTLFRREPGAREYLEFPIPEDFALVGGFSAIYEDRDGFLWAGTHGGGIGVWGPGRDQFTTYQHNPDDPRSLSNDVVLSFYQAGSANGPAPELGSMWIGTSGGGLNRFDPATHTFTRYTEEDGLPGETVRCILGDAEGFLWLGTNQGLSKFDPATETFHHYDVRDGLQGGEFYSCHQSDQGEMFFGGLQGFNAFFPERIEDNPNVPPIAITKLLQSNRVVQTDLPADAHIELAYTQNFLSFEFAALDYVAPEENQYAYMMEGLDAVWVRAGTRRHADYPNLRPGSYVFRVKGSNNDGIWNDEGAALRITITPPVWQTWWFQVLAGLLLVGGLVAGIWLRVRGLESQRQELEQQVAQRTAQLRQEMDQRIEVEQALRLSEAERAVVEERNRLARDLHDSVSQSLYSLTLLAEAGQRHAEKGELEPVQGYQSRIADIGHQALNEMRLLIYELRPPALESEGLVGALRQRLEAVEQRVGIDVRLVLEGEAGTAQLPATVEQELFRIGQEALNNALRHAAATSVATRIYVEAGEAGQHIELEVCDDGKGFDPAAVRDKGGMGLVSLRERAARIGATLTVHSAPGEGTRVRATLALRRDS
jgi:signal transduction histidine kinase/ligand-binding sensor domain-containing protein